MKALLFFLSTTAFAAGYGWTKIGLANISSSVKVTGRVIPLEGALNIESARVQGRVLNIMAREGDRVSPGMPLFLISSAECLSLQEEKRVAESRQIQDLIDGVKKREKQLGLRLHDDRCEIVANYSGSITKRSVDSGATFNTGDALDTILDTKGLSVELDLAERDVAQVHPGQKVEFRLATEPSKTYKTAVRSIVPAIDVTSRTARVRLNSVPLSPRATLDGLIFGEIETGTQDQVFTVPSEALVFDKNSRFVIRGPEATPKPIEVEVLSESSSQASLRPKHGGDLRDADEVATTHAIFLYKKLSEGAEQP
jgi:Cu(I)/Ag(I) efflux system membrane fusion protein